MKEKIVIETSSYMVEKVFIKESRLMKYQGNPFYESIRGAA